MPYEIQFGAMFKNYLIISPLRNKWLHTLSFLCSGHWWVISTKCYKAEIQQDDHSSGKKKNPFSSLLRFVHLYWKVTQHREKVCFLLLTFFSVSLITRYFYSVWKKSCNFSFKWQVLFFSVTFHQRDHTSANRFALIVPTDAPWGDTQHKAWFPTKLKTQMTKVNDPSTSSGYTDSSGRVVYGGAQCEDPEDSRGREEAAGVHSDTRDHTGRQDGLFDHFHFRCSEHSVIQLANSTGTC